MSPIGQINNPQMKDILESEFQRSSDPGFQHRILVSKYLNMPGIRGFWGPSYRNDTAYGGAPYWTDMSGNGYHVPTVVSVAVQRIALGFAFYEFGGANYGALADNSHFDITAAEAWIAYKGIALGAWVYTSRARPYAGSEGILTKWSAAAGNYGYVLDYDQNNNNNLSLILSSNGNNAYGFDHSKTILPNTWYFVAATYNPNAVLNEPAGVRLWVNDQMQYHNASDRGTAGLPASIFNNNQALQLGSWGGAANFLLGYASNWWICGNYVVEGDIYNLYETTKYMLGYMNEKGTAW